ncbi:MAG: hypothetical protein AVDCRST_MAG39-397 [uncultured Sphingomonadaceae bacterium]|uniref:Uncharacterized protein n=1 Tax=uncultured Sphingomonadaceae bacterium TaxID=169976 RepID=A0A6J4S278_9SPHN|nr:MAG: hypothetical protein AVDCRST_MAG39-397 [uncultured Sphingomonadaceae bacterium]
MSSLFASLRLRQGRDAPPVVEDAPDDTSRFASAFEDSGKG